MALYLGVDYGTKRIGLAVSDGGGTVAMPLKMVEARGALPQQATDVLQAASDYAVEAVVIGLPLNMDGTEGEQAKLTRRFGAALEKAATLPIHYFDERLTSHAAADALRDRGLTRKKTKARLDAVAAQKLLQGFLDQVRESG